MVIYNYNTALLFIAPAVRYFNRAPPGGCGPPGLRFRFHLRPARSPGVVAIPYGSANSAFKIK